MATIAMAAPTPTKTISKRSFAAKVKGHRKLSPKEAMERASRKYPGLEISVPESALKARHWDPEDFGDSSDLSWPSSFPWRLPSESAFVIWAQPSSSAFASASGSGFAIPSGFSAVPSGGFSAVPSGGFSAVPSGGFSAVPSGVSSVFPSGFSALPSGFSVAPSGLSVAPSSAFPSNALPSSAIASSGAPPVPSSAPPVQSSAPAPSSSASPGSGSETGDVSADPGPNDSFYLSPVTIGNQKLNLDFDTVSIVAVQHPCINVLTCNSRAVQTCGYLALKQAKVLTPCSIHPRALPGRSTKVVVG